MTRRPKLLFLAYYFPPAAAAASVRTWNIAKYLSGLGWDVTVVTPDPAIWRGTEDPEQVSSSLEKKGIHRIVTGHRWNCLNPVYLQVPDRGLGRLAGGVCRKISRQLGVEEQAGWNAAVERACRHLRPDDVDVILASGRPFGSFRLAKRLSDRLHRPFVLDYRDLWTDGPLQRHRLRTARGEERLLTRCAATTIVSPSCAASLRARFGDAARPHVLTNGYDPEEMADVRPHEFGHFAIVYAGIFYPPMRQISPVTAALGLLRENGLGAKPTADWRFHYYGPQEEHVRSSARQFGVLDRVICHGFVSRAEALSALRGAGIAVVITSVADEGSREDKGTVTSKLFDALGLGVPILLVSPPGGDAESIVQGSGCGRRFLGSDTAGIASYLVDAMAGRVARRDPPREYSWPTVIERLDHILKQALGDRVH